MDTIMWPGLARSALWIVGLAVAVAVASHASWRASQGGVCREPGPVAWLAPMSAGLLLVTISLAWGATTAWERSLWAASSLALSWPILDSLRRQRRQGRTGE